MGVTHSFFFKLDRNRRKGFLFFFSNPPFFYSSIIIPLSFFSFSLLPLLSPSPFSPPLLRSTPSATNSEKFYSKSSKKPMHIETLSLILKKIIRELLLFFRLRLGIHRRRVGFCRIWRDLGVLICRICMINYLNRLFFFFLFFLF